MDTNIIFEVKYNEFKQYLDYLNGKFLYFFLLIFIIILILFSGKNTIFLVMFALIFFFLFLYIISLFVEKNKEIIIKIYKDSIIIYDNKIIKNNFKFEEITEINEDNRYQVKTFDIIVNNSYRLVFYDYFFPKQYNDFVLLIINKWKEIKIHN